MNVGSRSVVESMVCNIVARNTNQPIHVIAHEIYTAHVKPLEDALTKAEANRVALMQVLESFFAEASALASALDTCSPMDIAGIISEGTLSKIRAALARVKEECGVTAPKEQTS